MYQVRTKPIFRDQMALEYLWIGTFRIVYHITILIVTLIVVFEGWLVFINSLENYSFLFSQNINEFNSDHYSRIGLPYNLYQSIRNPVSGWWEKNMNGPSQLRWMNSTCRLSFNAAEPETKNGYLLLNGYCWRPTSSRHSIEFAGKAWREYRCLTIAQTMMFML